MKYAINIMRTLSQITDVADDGASIDDYDDNSDGVDDN